MVRLVFHHEISFALSCSLAFIITVLAFSTPTVAAAVEGERVSVFLIGATHPANNPFTGYFMRDPLFTYAVEPIPPDLEDGEKQKLDRIYYPRTRQVLVENFDMIIFNDARIQHFTPRQYHDLDYAFREAGMASLATFGPAWEQIWEGSTLYDTSPALDYTDEWYHGLFRIQIRRDRKPVFTPFIDLGTEKILGDAFHLMVEKPGATIWADMLPRNVPWMISWRPGGSKAGLQWVCTDGFNAQWWGVAGSMHREGTFGVEGSNPYAIDLATNLILYSVGRSLISDIHLRREARYLLSAFQAQKLLILSMLEWAEKFGANILHLSDRLTEVEAEAQEAVDFYLEQDYPSTISFMESMSLTVCEISDESLRLKDEALFWVYVSEWLVVTSVALVAGVVVWSLMVRRRMYRAVRSTRLRAAY